METWGLGQIAVAAVALAIVGGLLRQRWVDHARHRGGPLAQPDTFRDGLVPGAVVSSLSPEDMARFHTYDDEDTAEVMADHEASLEAFRHGEDVDGDRPGPVAV